MKFLILLNLLFCCIVVDGQVLETAQVQSCQCNQLLEELINKVQHNYAGYIHKVKEGKDSTAYVLLKKKLYRDAASSSFKDCYGVLTEFVNYFNDGHLFVIEFPKNTGLQSDSLRQLIRKVSLTDEDIRKLEGQKTTDPIEGIWKDKDQRLAIIRSSAKKYLGIVIENTNTKWTRGMVKMEIEKVKPGEYFITIYRNDFAPIRFSKVHIYKNCILPFGFYRFAKISPADPELNYVNTTDPQLPFFQQLDAKNILLTVPTALIGRNILDSILRRYEKQIKTTENLIIDVRGNLGGNSIWRNLYGLANTKDYGPVKNENEDDFLMLASTDNADYVSEMAAYFRDTKDSGGIVFYDKLVAKINQNTGSIIGFSFYDPKPDTSRRMIYEFPKRVAILTDKGTASAGEAFVLSMRNNSSKVLVYGTNTYGMIDYMNINTRKIACSGNNSYYYGYPTFFSPGTKAKPINPTGIKPDIYIPARTADWIEWVRKDLVK